MLGACADYNTAWNNAKNSRMLVKLLLWLLLLLQISPPSPSFSATNFSCRAKCQRPDACCNEATLAWAKQPSWHAQPVHQLTVGVVWSTVDVVSYGAGAPSSVSWYAPASACV